MPAHVAGETSARNSADLRADHLNRAHQRIGEKKRPTEAVTELRARLRIGRNSARIVVRRPRDETRTQHIAKLWPLWLFKLVSLDPKLAHLVPLASPTYESGLIFIYLVLLFGE